MFIRKMNLLRSSRLPKRAWGAGVFSTALLMSSASAFPAAPRATTDAPPHDATASNDGAAGRVALGARLRSDFMAARKAKARYDMPKLLSLVTDCRNVAFRLQKLKVAKTCDELALGVAQRLGDAKAMVEAEYWWQQHGLPEAGEGSKAYPAFRKANLAQLVDTTPALSVVLAGSPSVLAYQHRIGISGAAAAQPLAWHRPTVTATINGKPVTVLVDTGTVVPLVMDRTYAAALGAIPLLDGMVPPGMDKAASPETRGFARVLIGTFTFGGLVMHNVSATVVPDGTFAIGVLAGLPVLAHFGRVDLNDTRIAIGSAVPNCTGSVPLRFVGEGQLGFSTSANGQPAMAFVDTGDVNALTARLQPRPVSLDAKGSKPEYRLAAAELHDELRVQVGSWSVTRISRPSAMRVGANRAAGAKRALPPGIDVNIGAPLLALADVQIDFSKPSLCVNPKPAVSTGAVIVLGNGREQ